MVSRSIMTTDVSDFFFFFNDTATTEIYTLSLHDALPIFQVKSRNATSKWIWGAFKLTGAILRDLHALWLEREKADPYVGTLRSEEHTSELQSRQYLVCRLLLEKKKIP